MYIQGWIWCRGQAERPKKFLILFTRAVELFLFQKQHHTMLFFSYHKPVCQPQGASKRLWFSIGEKRCPFPSGEVERLLGWSLSSTPDPTTWPFWNQNIVISIMKPVLDWWNGWKKVTLLTWILMKTASVSKAPEPDRKKKCFGSIYRNRNNSIINLSP